MDYGNRRKQRYRHPRRSPRFALLCHLCVIVDHVGRDLRFVVRAVPGRKIARPPRAGPSSKQCARVFESADFRKSRRGMSLRDFESLSVPPRTEGTVYEPRGGGLTANARRLLTGEAFFRSCETTTAGLTAGASARREAMGSCGAGGALRPPPGCKNSAISMNSIRLRSIRDAAGHSSVLVTSAYLHVAVEDDGAVGSLFRVG